MDRDDLIDIGPGPSLARDFSPPAQWQTAERSFLGGCADLSPTRIEELLELWPVFETPQEKFRNVSNVPDENETTVCRDDDGDERPLLDIIELYRTPGDGPEHFNVDDRPVYPAVEKENVHQQPPSDILDFQEDLSSLVS
jgi:hypothetical protein